MQLQSHHPRRRPTAAPPPHLPPPPRRRRRRRREPPTAERRVELPQSPPLPSSSARACARATPTGTLTSTAVVAAAAVVVAVAGVADAGARTRTRTWREGSGRSQQVLASVRVDVRERGGMGVSGEGAVLRSARKWLLLLCPEIQDRGGGKESVAVTIVVVKAAGYLGRSQRRHGMAYGAARKQHDCVAGAYKRRNTQGRVEGAFPYLNWRLCTGSCSAGSTRPETPAFGRRRSRPLADRCLRPPSTVDRGLRPPLQIAGSRSMLQLLIHESMNEVVKKCDHWHGATPPSFGPK